MTTTPDICSTQPLETPVEFDELQDHFNRMMLLRLTIDERDTALNIVVNTRSTQYNMQFERPGTHAPQDLIRSIMDQLPKDPVVTNFFVLGSLGWCWLAGYLVQASGQVLVCNLLAGENVLGSFLRDNPLDRLSEALGKEFWGQAWESLCLCPPGSHDHG